MQTNVIMVSSRVWAMRTATRYDSCLSVIKRIRVISLTEWFNTFTAFVFG